MIDIFTQLSGDSYQIGSQHGAKHCQSLGKIYIGIDEICRKRYGKSLHLLFSDPLIRYMIDRLPHAMREEAIAIAEAAAVPVDLIYFMILIQDYEMIVRNRSAACSVVVTPEFVLRTLDWWVVVRDLMPPYQQVFRYDQPGRQPFLSVAWIGCPVVYTGLGKVFAALLALSSWQTDIDGTPIAIILRDIVERAADITEALDILRSRKTTAVFNVVIADQFQAVAATVSPAKVWIENISKRCEVTNHPVCLEGLQRLVDWIGDGQGHIDGGHLDLGLLGVSLSRKAKLWTQARFTKDDMESMQRFIRSSLVSFNWKAATITGAIWPRHEPALYVAFNDKTPVTTGTFHRFELGAPP